MQKKILIVEDDTLLQDVLRASFTGAGFKVLTAHDGHEGLLQLKSERPDLILLDIIMPGIDGYEVLRQIKAKPETAGIPVIIMSNLGDLESVKTGTDLGATAYIIKASSIPADIVAKVRTVLAQHP